ncbi:MAG: hypothetical protein JSW40_08925 [Candidatus Omnitrophota bacterium]|nr:MAG: hypothetical protein JSW40_08925 [Candidatus Omnitrophota bacterium]
MQKPTLLYYTILQYQLENLELLHSKFNVIELSSPDQDTPQALAQADVILVPLGYYLNPEKIDKAKKLKIIASNTTGHPHIDVDYARSKGIEVVTLKDHRDFLSTITPTAELTWALIIMLTRNTLSAYKDVLKGNWNRRPFGGTKMLSRMSLGIAGLGRLGSMVASYGKSFGMKVKFYDPHVTRDDPEIEQVESLEELVSVSDIVSIHIPHQPDTDNLFNRELFKHFKKGAYFINTSRGELLNHEALLEALENKTLAGAAIDVFENEFSSGFQENFRNHPLLRYAQNHDNLIVTPHIGGSTIDAWKATEEFIIRKIIDVLKEVDTAESVRIQVKEKFNNQVWAIIPARGGSKTIPLKNIVSLNGRPLIDYVIEAAKASSCISRIICSTENAQIATLCKQRGIEVQERPFELAQDNASTKDVIADLIKRLMQKEKSIADILVLLEPTSPFVLPSHIDECVRMLQGNPGADSVQAITSIPPNHHAYNQRYIRDKEVHFQFEDERIKFFNKQLKPEFYVHGNLRVFKAKAILTREDLYGSRSLPYFIPRIYAMDVDGPEDLKVADALLKSGVVQAPYIMGKRSKKVRLQKKISAVINARLESSRVSRKMVRPFAGTTLIEIALEKLNSLNFFDHRFFAVAEDELKQRAAQYENIEVLERKPTAVAPGPHPPTVTFEHYMRIPTEYIFVINACSAFLSVETIRKAYDIFQVTDYPSYISVIPTRDWIFTPNGVALTHRDPYILQNTSDTEIFYKVSHSFYIVNRDNFIKTNGILWSLIPNDPYLIPITPQEAYDVDTEAQFELYSSLYESKMRTIEEISKS